MPLRGKEKTKGRFVFRRLVFFFNAFHRIDETSLCRFDTSLSISFPPPPPQVIGVAKDAPQVSLGTERECMWTVFDTNLPSQVDNSLTQPRPRPPLLSLSLPPFVSLQKQPELRMAYLRPAVQPPPDKNPGDEVRRELLSFLFVFGVFFFSWERKRP